MEEALFNKNELLSRHTTFKIGGSADFFIEAKSEEEIIKSLDWAKENNKRVLILGGGSNVLVSDKGWSGLVIKIRLNFLEIAKEDDEYIFLNVGAGVPLARLVLDSVREGWSNLKWAAGIPGLVGGAVYGNAGAYGHSISEFVEEVRGVNIETKESKSFSKQEASFSYRESFFKENDDWIITSVLIKLKKERDDNGMEEIKERIILRNKKIPPYPSAGSVFKNIIVADLNEDQLSKISKEMIKGGKLPTGWLIEQCQLKGKEKGGAMISSLHANYIINSDNAKARDVVYLMDLCKKKVWEKFKINLEEEIKLIGF